MSNKIIIVWGLIIVSLVCAVYFIGIKYEEELKYVNLKNEVKESVKNYVEEKELDLPLTVTTETLESEGFIGELKLGEKICAADVKVSKKWLFYSYDINFVCVNPKAL